jgi:hypothetical protein
MPGTVFLAGGRVSTKSIVTSFSGTHAKGGIVVLIYLLEDNKNIKQYSIGSCYPANNLGTVSISVLDRKH